MRKLLVATKNKGKFKEFYGILRDLPYGIITLDQAGIDFEVQENGKTFEENAILKAKEYAKKTGFLTLADDSGLCVDYLNGDPGIKSARYIDGSDKDRYEYLLKQLENIPKEKRTAVFISVIAVFDPETKKMITTKGECPGKIAFEPKGANGFGYDPIFIVDELGKHFAELSFEEKIQVSHRAKALQKIKPCLKNTSI
jgi:XTP/dITP diphosphohydrolase